MPAQIRGLSLFELVVSLAVIGTILAIGVPSFAGILAKNQQRAEIDALFHAVHLAKKTSIVRNQVVSLCPSSDLQRCNPARNWSDGWLMFENVDRDAPPQVDPGESILRRHTVSDATKIRANRRGFTFRATQKRATNGTVVVCDRQQRIAPLALVINHLGRPRTTRNNLYGAPYHCND